MLLNGDDAVTVYLALWLYLLTNYILMELIKSKRIKNVILLLTIVVTAFVFVLRDLSGSTDYDNYEGGYFRVMLASDNILNALKVSFATITRYPPLFMSLLFMLGKISDSFRIVTLIIILLEMMIDAYSFKRLNVNPLLGIIGKISLLSITWYVVSKQAIVVSLILLSYAFWVEGKKKRYYFTLLIGLGIHVTAICGFIFVIADKISIKRRNFIIWIWLVLMSFPMGKVINHIMLAVWNRSAGYSSDGAGKSWKMSVFLIIVDCFIYLVCTGHKDKMTVSSVNLAMLAMVLSFASTQGLIIRRLVYCFLPFCVISWINSCKLLNIRSNQRIVRGVVMLIFFIGYAYLSYRLPAYTMIDLDA